MEYNSEKKIYDQTATVYSNTIFFEITKGTDFEDDEEMQKHLDMFSNTFVEMIETEHGTFVLQSLEENVKAIHDQKSFVSSLQLISKLVQELDITSTEQFALFLGCVGIVIALVSHHGPATTISNDLEKSISLTYQLILYTALVPFWSRTTKSIENFFLCDFVNVLDN